MEETLRSGWNDDAPMGLTHAVYWTLIGCVWTRPIAIQGCWRMWWLRDEPMEVWSHLHGSDECDTKWGAFNLKYSTGAVWSELEENIVSRVAFFIHWTAYSWEDASKRVMQRNTYFLGCCLSKFLPGFGYFLNVAEWTPILDACHWFLKLTKWWLEVRMVSDSWVIARPDMSRWRLSSISTLLNDEKGWM